MPRSHLVYLAVGNNPGLHAQAAYSMLSALAFKDSASAELHFFTDVAVKSADAADTYSLLLNHVTLDSLSPVRIAALVPGPYDPYRLKLSVLREIAQRFPSDASVFLDADTFFLAPYAPLLDRISSGARVLHRREYDIATHPTPQMAKFRRALRAAGLSSDHAPQMWNSGVIGLPPHSAWLLDDALKTLAQLSPHTSKEYLAEQFSISRALSQQYPPQSAEDFLFHYWYQKADYTRAIRERLSTWQSLPLAEACAQLRNNPLHLPAPPQRLHWWERALISGRLRRRPQEIRGLPRP